MRIGLVTYYGHNYGACLQAFALQNTLEKMGHSVIALNYTRKDELTLSFALKRRLSALKNPIKYITNKILYEKHKKHFTARSSAFEQFIEKYINKSKVKYDSLEEMKKIDEFDIYVCGSDQLWNPVFRGNKNNPVYFIDFAPEGKKRIAYAPSIGVNSIPDECKKEMSILLRKMDHISVRERLGATIIKDLINKDVNVVLDPTLLISPDEWNSVAVDPEYKDPYILTYLFGDLDYIKDFIQHIKKITGLEIISLPYNPREMSGGNIKAFEAGPSEFVGLIKNAKIVITDSFHATVFSIIFKKPFYSLTRQKAGDPASMNSRIFDILERLKLSSRLIVPGSEFPSGDVFQIDYSETDIEYSKEYSSSINYLKSSTQ